MHQQQDTINLIYTTYYLVYDVDARMPKKTNNTNKWEQSNIKNAYLLSRLLNLPIFP